MNRLGERRLIEREGCPHDRRGIYAKLTASGKKALLRAQKVCCAAIEQLLGNPLDEEEKEVFILILQKLQVYLNRKTNYRES